MRNDQNTTCRWIRTIYDVLQRYIKSNNVSPHTRRRRGWSRGSGTVCMLSGQLWCHSQRLIVHWGKIQCAGELGERRRCYAILLSRTSKCCGNYFPEMLSLIINQGAGQVYESVKHVAFKTQFSCRDSPCVSETNKPAIQYTGLPVM